MRQKYDDLASLGDHKGSILKEQVDSLEAESEFRSYRGSAPLPASTVQSFPVDRTFGRHINNDARPCVTLHPADSELRLKQSEDTLNLATQQSQIAVLEARVKTLEASRAAESVRSSVAHPPFVAGGAGTGVAPSYNIGTL